jgi:hypothetical protein
MLLELVGSQSSFLMSFSNWFPLCYQNLCVDLFYARFDFGIDICGVWLLKLITLLILIVKNKIFIVSYNLGSKLEFS